MTEQVAADANDTSVMDAGISSVLGDVNEPRSANADVTPIVDDEPGKMVGAKTDGDEAGTDGKKPDDDDKGKVGADGKPAANADDDRFDKHPRFQELIQGRQKDAETIAQLMAKIDTLTSIVSGKAPAKEDGKEAKPDEPIVPYKDIAAMEDDQLREWQEDDPKGYAGNLLAQVVNEAITVINRIQSEKAQKTEQEARTGKIQETFKQYGEKNPDFKPMWDSGEIQKYIDENPGHNAISAHMALTEEKRITAAAAKAAKEAEEKVVKNFQAKRNASVLDGGAGGMPPAPGEKPELSDTKQHGGLMSVLAQNLRKMREAGG